MRLPDGNDCDALRADPAFKMAVGRLPERGADLCPADHLPAGNLPVRRAEAHDGGDGRAVLRQLRPGAAAGRLDIDDTEERVHGGQQLALFHAHYDSRCLVPIHIYERAAASRWR